MYSVCHTCDGDGYLMDDDGLEIVCPDCSGLGRIEYYDDDVEEFDDEDFIHDDTEEDDE